jgi:uncharacterized protein YecT (DUF1311 family)
VQSPQAECQICGKPFNRQRMGQKVCGYRCAAKVPSRANKARKDALKSRSQWMKEAQTAFNAWIRARDAKLPCISCGRDHEGQWHAGHYLSTGARPELRFDPANVHKQCQPCNTHLHGNLVLYRAELIRRVGLAEVERLEGPGHTQKYTVDDLRRIRDEYRAKTKGLP